METLYLKNGLRLLLDKIPTVQSVAVGVMVEVGTKHENEKENGIVHFIEHLLFKNSLSFTNKSATSYIESLGGQLHAFTGKEFTCYYSQILNYNLVETICIIRDMVFSFNINNVEFEKEKQVIIQEILKYEDDTPEQLKILCTQESLNNCSHAFDILGSISNVSSFSNEEVLEFYKKFYTASNSVISISGNFCDEDIENIKKILNAVPAGEKTNKDLSPVVFRGGVKFIEKMNQQAHICFHFPGIASTVSPVKYYAYLLLSNIVGGGQNSLLHRALREEKGIVYSVYSQPIIFKEIGLLRLFASTSSEKLEEAYDLILEIVLKLRENIISQEDFLNAKVALKSELVFSHESTISRMFFYGQEALLGIYHSSNLLEILNFIDSVSMDDIKQLIASIFREDYFLGIAASYIEPIQKIINNNSLEERFSKILIE